MHLCRSAKIAKTCKLYSNWLLNFFKNKKLCSGHQVQVEPNQVGLCQAKTFFALLFLQPNPHNFLGYLGWPIELDPFQIYIYIYMVIKKIQILVGHVPPPNSMCIYPYLG